MSKYIIKTSDSNFSEKVLIAIRDKVIFTLKDDDNLGIKKEDLKDGVHFIKALYREGASKKDLSVLLAGIGISSMGIGLILIAVFDPEPTTKLVILLAGGVVLMLTGSLAILQALKAPMKVKFGTKGFDVSPA